MHTEFYCCFSCRAILFDVSLSINRAVIIGKLVQLSCSVILESICTVIVQYRIGLRSLIVINLRDLARLHKRLNSIEMLVKATCPLMNSLMSF